MHQLTTNPQHEKKPVSINYCKSTQRVENPQPLGACFDGRSWLIMLMLCEQAENRDPF